MRRLLPLLRGRASETDPPLLDVAASQLQSVLSELDAEIARIDERVKDVQVKRQGLFDGPDFRKHPVRCSPSPARSRRALI